MNKIFVINGNGGVGKDTFINCCKDISSKYIMSVSMADSAKILASTIGWDGEKDERGRRFLSDIKDAIDRYDDRSFKYVNNFISSYDDVIIFIHSRQPEDIKRFIDKYNATTILVVNNNVPQINSNHADANVYDMDYDYIVDNSYDLDHLNQEAQNFLERMGVECLDI